MSQATTQKGSSMTAISFAVFAVVCIVAFLAYRGSDIGQLPKFIVNFGGGPLTGELVFDCLIGILVAIFIFQACIGVGKQVCRFIMPSWIESSSVWLLLGGLTAVGAATWSIIWFFLGLVGLYTPVAAIASIAFGNILLAVPTGRAKSGNVDYRYWNGKSIGEWIYVTLGMFPIFLGLIAALAPLTAKDSLLYHFAVPKAFIAQHSNAFIDGNIASYLSLGAEMHPVWAMLLGGLFSPRAAEAAAGAIIFLFFPLLLLTIYGWSREIGISRHWALLATALVTTVPTAYHVASSGYIDLSLALYVTLAAYGLTRWWKEQTWGWVILIGIFLGAALSVKLTTVFVIAAFALIILLRARNPVAIAPGSDTAVVVSPGKIVMGGFAALFLAGVIASPWYMRTWVATGSPVFPFYMSIWPGKAAGWDVERSNLFQGMNSQYGGVDTDKINYLTAPVRLSVAAQPEQPANYDGVLGVAFLIGLPLLIWALWKFDLAVEIKIMAGVAGVMYLFWLFSSEQLRYLLPIAPLLAIAIAASAEKIGNGISKVAQYALVAASVCGILTTLAWFCQKAPLRVVLGGETRDQYLARNLDYYSYYQWLNTETPPDAKVWLINMRRDTYNIERPIFSDYLFEDWTLRKMVWESNSAQELRTKTAAMGIKYVLTRHDFLFDYDRSTLVDDKKPRAENEAKLKIAKDLILDTANTIKSDNKFSLVKVF
ncbi:MAG: glycosyltransferase family 39 protein [Chloracidobacterium sp.]|nr:glycosyltransferase family 39 protein [Chloracidobacterium sp.]